MKLAGLLQHPDPIIINHTIRWGHGVGTAPGGSVGWALGWAVSLELGAPWGGHWDGECLQDWGRPIGWRVG